MMHAKFRAKVSRNEPIIVNLLKYAKENHQKNWPINPTRNHNSWTKLNS